MAITVKETGELCVGCGACAAICPLEAIELNYDSRGYRPTIGPKCTDCGTCLKVCPGISWNASEIDWNRPLGGVKKTLIGHATTLDIKCNSSSGGAVPAIILRALEEGQLNGAIVTRMSDSDPLRAEPFLANSKEDIFSSMGSKYCPAPVALAIRDLLKSPMGKYAIVGLPCHLRAIHRAGLVFPELNKKIALRIGLLCNHTPTPEATRDLILTIGERPEDIEHLSYRSGTDKFSMFLQTHSGKKVLVQNYWGSGFGKHYEPYACSICPDHTNEGADISVGDPHGLLSSGIIGESLIIIRTKTGDDFVNEAINGGVLKVDEIEIQRVENTLREKILPRKGYLRARLAIAQSVGRPIPQFTLKPPWAPPYAYIRAIIFYIHHILMELKILRTFSRLLHPLIVTYPIEEIKR